MKDIIIDNEIKLEVIKYFGYENCKEQKDFYLNEAPNDLFKFYYTCMNQNIEVCDADRYANLNTVIGYDIGFENFQKIDSYLWNERDFDLMELFGNEDGKEIIRDVADTLKINIDLNKWNDGEIKEYVYCV